MGEEYPDEVDALVTPWLKQHTKKELLDICIRNRIPFAPELSIDELMESPHLNERGFFVEVNHPEIGKLKYPGAAAEFSETRSMIRRAAPLLGEHTELVCKEILEMDDEEVAQLVMEGVLF